MGTEIEDTFVEIILHRIISVVCISSLSAKLRRSAAAMMWHGVISRAGRGVSSLPLRRYAVMVVACCSYKLRDDGVIVQGKYMQYEQSEVSSSISNIIFNREWIRSNPILMKLLINNLFNKKAFT
ncbi:50S ribosomal protein [Dirofilaria immitis]